MWNLKVLVGMIVLVYIFSRGLAAEKSKIKSLKLTKINCTCYDETFVHYDRCIIKAINRDTNTVNIRYRFFKLPIKKYSVRLNFKYRANGWKPFLYDVTVDICQFMRRVNTPIGKLFFQMIRDNDSFKCPVTDSEQAFENLTNKHIADVLKNLPVPPGDYALFSSWYNNDVMHATVDFYASIK